jgi:hypothetical protein
VRLGDVRQVGPGAVADVEQVAEHRDAVALAAFTEELGDGDTEMLTEQVQQCAFQGGDGVDGGALIVGLPAATMRVEVCVGRGDGAEQAGELSDRPAQQQFAGGLDGTADRFAARGFSDADVAGAVGEDRDGAGEERAVRAAEVEQHAVVPGDGDHLDPGDGGGPCVHDVI